MERSVHISHQMHKLRFFPIIFHILLLAFLGVSASTLGQERPLNIGVTVKLDSKVLNETREIWISTPAEYHLSQQAYPVLYILDPRWHFKHTVGTAEFLRNQQKIPPMIVVGIVSHNRPKDMLPQNLGSAADRFGANIGGADKFIQFIDEEVDGYLQKHYRVAPYKMLFGHSLGGFFVLHALQTKPNSFNFYHALSPSLQYLADGYMDDWLTKVDAESITAKELFVSIGSEEQSLRDDIDTFITRPLRKSGPQSLAFNTAIIPGNHSSMVQGATIQALTEHFADWSPAAAPKAYNSGGYNSLRDHLAAVSERYPFATRSLINNKMYSVAEDLFVNQGLLDTAVDVGEQLIADFPDQVLTQFHEALGRGYYLQGEQEKTVATLTKVYALNPGSGFAVEVLSQPGVDAGVQLPPEPPKAESLQKYIGTYHVNGIPVLETFIRDDGLWVNHLQEPLLGPLRWLGGQDFYAIGTETVHYQFQTDNNIGVITGVRRDSELGVVTARKE